MTILKRTRFLYWLIAEFGKKYAKSIGIGVLVGLVVMVLFWYFAPQVAISLFSPVERIGVVGQFTPATVPLYVQKDVSFGLTKISDDGTATKGFAESWEATDSGKTYIFSLRKDLAWHNGDPVTARDINYNIRDVTFEVVDDHTIIAKLLDPYSPFPTLVSKPIFRKGLLGFGEYKVINLQLKGDTIEYLKLEPLDPKKIMREYRFYRNESEAVVAFKLGDIDVVSDISDPSQLAGWKGAIVEKSIRFDRVVALFFNTLQGRMIDKSVRQALAYALPKEYPGDQAFGPIASKSWAYTDKVRHYSQNLQLAKKTLTGSPLASTSATLTLSTFPSFESVANSIAASWNNIGIGTQVKLENSLPSDFEVFLSAQTIPPDPDQYPFWHSTQSQTNITGFTNVKIDKLLEDARRETNIEKRKKLYADFQRFLVEEAPAVFLYYPPSYTIRRASR